MNRVKTLTVFNAIMFLIANFISYGSNTGFFNGQTIGEVSDKYNALFVPTGFTFAIWGLIYTSLYAFVIYHLAKAFNADANQEANQDVLKINWLFVVNNLAAAAWVIVWTYEMLLLSVVLMLIQLITLIAINIRLHIYSPYRSLASRVFTQFPLAIYFAWICIATIANISSSLVGLGWDGGPISPVIWTIILIGVAALLSLFIIFIRRNVFFGFVVIWALYGIIYKRTQAGEEMYRDIITASWAGILIIAIAIVIQMIKNYKMDSERNISLDSSYQE